MLWITSFYLFLDLQLLFMLCVCVCLYACVDGTLRLRTCASWEYSPLGELGPWGTGCPLGVDTSANILEFSPGEHWPLPGRQRETRQSSLWCKILVEQIRDEDVLRKKFCTELYLAEGSRFKGKSDGWRWKLESGETKTVVILLIDKSFKLTSWVNYTHLDGDYGGHR